MVGTTLAARYELQDRIALGGMGSVFEANDTRLGRKVALKLLKEDLAQDPRFVERFRREARAAGALSHPNIASVFDYGEDTGRHFIVMELVAGRDLARVLREEGPLSAERAVRIADQIAQALAHAHEGGLVHRDVKPANVIVGNQDRVKVTDFGIARAEAETSLTATGSVLGTAQYISPEQASGDNVGPPSDVYSLGVVLYEMLTGSVPFTGDSAVAVAMRHVSDRVPPPSALNPDVDPWLDEVVAKATAKRPQDRYPTAAGMAAVLAGTGELQPTAPFAQEEPTKVMSGADTATAVIAADTASEGEAWPFPAHPPRWDPRSIGRAVIAIFILLALIAAGLLLYRLANSEEPKRERRGAAVPTQQEEPQTFALPDVTDRDYEEAEAILEDLDLVVERRDEPNDEGYPEGTVFDMAPDAETQVSAGQTITLFVSTGPSEEEGDDDIVDEITETPFTPPGQEKKDEKDDD